MPLRHSPVRACLRPEKIKKARPHMGVDDTDRIKIGQFV